MLTMVSSSLRFPPHAVSASPVSCLHYAVKRGQPNGDRPVLRASAVRDRVVFDYAWTRLGTSSKQQAESQLRQRHKRSDEFLAAREQLHTVCCVP